MTPADVLRRDLANHHDLEVAAMSGALQLLPENAGCCDRLVAMAAVALSGGGAGTQEVDRADLRTWLVDSPSLHEGPAWDPYEGPFAEPLTFIGGGYLMLTGGEPESVAHIRTLLYGLIRRRQPLEQTTFNQSLMSLAMGVLALSNHACQAAQIRRWASAGTAKEVFVPEDDVLEQLRAGVVYTEVELSRITRRDAGALQLIVRDLDAEGPPPQTPTDTQFNTRPLLRRGDVYVLVEPGALAVALRHALITLALTADLRSELVGWLARAAIDQVSAAARRLDWDLQEEVPAPDAPIVSLVGAFDTDKAINLAIVYEDLEAYEPDNPYASWNAGRWETALVRHLRRIEELAFFGPGPRPNEILHLIVVAGCGRPYFLGLPDGDDPVGAPHRILTLEALDRISMGAHDRLRLWKHARASDHLRRECRVLTFGALDEFAAWNEDQSYYLDDEARPTMIVFDGSYGRAFRERIARETDVHAALTPRSTWVEVVRLESEEHIPIYAVLHDLGGQPVMLVEGASVPIWIQARRNYDQPAHREPHLQLVDCLAYWLWQLTPSLPDFAGQAGLTRLIVEVEAEEPAAWIGAVAPDASGPVSTTKVIENEMLHVTVHPSLIGELDRADNQGERALVRSVLLGLDELLDPSARRGESDVDATVDRHAPLGPKKKINLLSADVDSALIGGPLPTYRRISPAENDRLLDQAGDHLAERFSLPVGRIPSERQNTVLNSVVAFHFEQLEREVGVLSPSGLLEYLVSRHEAVLRREAVQRRTGGARIAAYGETGLLEEIRRALPEATQTAVALRFLIEYVTAQPPTGLRPMSLDCYDRLLAICGQIVSRGWTSDIVHFEIEDTQLSFLGSGRLGLAAGAFQTGQQTFLDDVLPEHVRTMGSRYNESWQRDEPTAPASADELDAAATAEWGFSLLELLEFFQALSISANERSGGATSLPESELENELATRLEWRVDRVRDAIALHSLAPRDDYATPPAGFKRHDVWPWRFNRSLSYMRRPLLRRRSNNDEYDYVWGVRHPEQTGRFLFELISSERLRAESDEMKRVMTRLRQAETEAFVNKIAAVHRDHGMAVDVNVKKVDGERITRANNEDLTDIDVLAADPATKVIHALECKDLEGAKTPAELHNELASTFASGGRTRSAAEKQMERVAWLYERIGQTLRHLGIEEAEAGWEVRGAIVTDVHVLSPYVGDCPLPVYAWAQLEARFSRE